ncbi:hypothetical protein [Magnetospira sp. QH-2]|uniref:hypothetical protein n=1 Tax=Magnetospira sp. (strain QH-2) TaxID=1288970 RepID=UPI0003E8199B|nr:hypothetical protein [Magnetospira sp. QH-2]CCQ73479.1 Conserved protein of unknown function [Magnetospira sp. QH-2]
MKRDDIAQGDIYVKYGATQTRWAVERFFEYTDIPPHVRLVSLGDRNRTITVALSALQDGKHYRREPTTS